ncbi:MAG TPA: FimV/HubP family polar landmark protein [Dokdonella sp.]|uniref:FimV/HubP family polar landmark protein n=1 Tax=Dokdonella sp. TaxID=2291710 RepID=UPI002D7E19DB|nr:FimV/HubP family polar landmark protein [Dokdonella sp.]HET9032439.1 FimV/HubP family polar landmark protein [Dokdonella sp.]
MKRPLQLSLAIALALGATNAFALGLGVIQVQSGLNQPLVAEIPIIQSSPGEAEGLIVQLATAEDFERVGMNRESIGVPVEFSVTKNSRGEPVIRVTSKEIVREPFLGMLLEANWPKGRLLREYTVLLDPPVMAPAVKGASAVAVAAKEPARTATQPLPASKAPAPKPAPPVAAAPAPQAQPVPPASTPRAAGGNEYGPVASGETLGEIARSTRPDETVTVNQMMVALLKNNPSAFFKDNVNALKRGAVLRIPSAEEIAATGSAREAAAAVRSQIEEWRGSVSSTPTLVADTSAASASRSSSSATSSARSERLALVPPREGKAGESGTDRPSGGRAGGSGDAASKAELARVREALTSKEQEASELKSRVKDLEDIKGKNQKLITLQSTELAELRDKLKKMQEEASKASAAAAAAAKTAESTPAPTVTTVTAPPVDETVASNDDAKPGKDDDIWGDASSTKSTSPAATDASASTATPAVDNAGMSTSTDSSSLVQTPPAVVETPKPKPANVVEPEKPVVKTTPKPAPVAETTPWYLESWVLVAAGVGGLLLVLLGIFGLRKRKPAVTTARPSIAGAFGDSPLGPAPGDSDADVEEQELIAQVQADPGNSNAHLELLSLYYAQGATDKFESAAEEMYANIADPNESNWREVHKMGVELMPHNPLFSDTDSVVDEFAQTEESEDYTFEAPEDGDLADFPDFDDEESEKDSSAENFETSSMPEFDAGSFDLGETKLPEAAPEPSSDTSFSFDLPPLEEAPDVSSNAAEPEAEESIEPLPPVDFDTPDKSTVEVPVAEVSDEEFFSGEDAIGTKLDLAKAYLDMGDPDGARSMLEEVLAEGSSSQQDEARKLIAEIN